ncbi:uncharacterized protein ANIA_07217 [Aspergillus nidulans FGSC A4]|uniref:Uncharacterized protein n=1 Tax=Emericella nidulans (strain FGSC A4 / ATCC 38163 / CBS 112.46 / NRRL 194 / M139) TaxID=227321 RepID=C8VCZ9_EMENI|nr:hypothetical protein [Aspergillus nidulans FGSC A4]CBF78837.1 TPA: conserved hypothetical protein [Aspergillus nidulans FGSC A4]
MVDFPVGDTHAARLPRLYPRSSKHPYSPNSPTNPHTQLHCQEEQSRNESIGRSPFLFLLTSVPSLTMPMAMNRGQVDPAPTSARHEEVAGPMEALILRESWDKDAIRFEQDSGLGCSRACHCQISFFLPPTAEPKSTQPATTKPNQSNQPTSQNSTSKCLPATATAAPATATPALAAPAPTKYLFCRVVLCPCSAISTSQLYLNQATTRAYSSIRPCKPQIRY